MKFLTCSALFLLILFTCSCKPKQEDPRIPQLQSQVEDLNRRSNEMQQELQQLQQELEAVQTRTMEVRSQTQSSAPASVNEMTVLRMRREVEPLLTKIVEQRKAATDTASKGDQFGMRIEYDMKHAVYGLVRTQDQSAPYLAKILVPYQRFVASNKETHEYGNGTTQFVFAYIKGKWQLQAR